jgi:hypothetical protein
LFLNNYHSQPQYQIANPDQLHALLMSQKSMGVMEVKTLKDSYPGIMDAIEVCLYETISNTQGSAQAKQNHCDSGKRRRAKVLVSKGRIPAGGHV